MTDPCNGLAGLLFGHKYQPRYNSGAATLTNFKARDVFSEDVVAVLEASKPTTYVHDVCVRCGAIAEGAK